MAIKEQEFVEAAKSLGLSKLRILLDILSPIHLDLPLSMQHSPYQASFFEASLSYLGVGIEAPNFWEF